MTIQTAPVPFSEPWRATALRTGSLALAIGIVAGLVEHRFATVPLTTLLALWFTLGGHIAELLFRNYLRARISGQVPVQVARLIYWFGTGSALYAGALATQAVLTKRGPGLWPWWTGGVLFVGLELVVHLLLVARRQPSFYDGRG